MKQSDPAMGRPGMKLLEGIRSLFGLKKHGGDKVEEQPGDAIDKPVEMLRGLPWMTSLKEDVFRELTDAFVGRKFPEGEIILKEDEPDNGMFVIVSGEVRIEIRGVPMNVVGTASLIGEMSVLTGYPRSASVIAVSPVTVVWIESARLKAIMKKSPELENGLWEFTSKRFAMNLLGKKMPYSQWEQNIFIQWLASGEVRVPDAKGGIDLKGKIGVLVTGTACPQDGDALINAPATLSGSSYVFSKEARVFIRDK